MNLIAQFGINPVLLAAQAVNFLILLFILKKLLYKPILKVLKDRQEKIAKSLADAAQIEQRLLKIEEDREKALKKASDEGQKIIDQATLTSTEIIKQAHAKAALDTEDMVRDSREQIRVEQEKMRNEIRAELGSLVVTSLQKVSGKVLTKKDQQNILSSSIKELRE